MPVCPFGTHRLRLDADAQCQHCGSDLALYGAVRDLGVRFYNEARRRWDADDLAAAGAWLEASLHLRDDLAESHWLLGLVRRRQGREDLAQDAFARAQALGARIEP